MRITLLIALGLVLSLSGCCDSYGNTNVVFVVSTPNGLLVATNGRVTSFPAIPAPIIPTPRPNPYKQPNPASLRNTNLTLPNKPSEAYVKRYNALRKDYHMDSNGFITKVVSTNAVVKH